MAGPLGRWKLTVAVPLGCIAGGSGVSPWEIGTESDGPPVEVQSDSAGIHREVGTELVSPLGRLE